MRRRRLVVLCAAFLLLALAGGAGAASNPVRRSPSLLWKSYPLKQRTAASQLVHPLRPPALAVGTGSSSVGGIGGTPYLAFLALLGGAMLALTGLAAKSLIKEGATVMAGHKGRSAEPEPASTEDAKPDLLVALRPIAVTVEEEPDLAESQKKTPVAPRLAPIEDEGEVTVEPEQSDQAPSAPRRPLRMLLVHLQSAKNDGAEAERPPLRALPHRLLRAIEEPEPDVETPAEEEEPEAELLPPLEVAAETGPMTESEPESKRIRREASPEEDTEVVVESCQIRLWRGYFRYQLYVAPGSSDINRAVALSPYFRLSDPDAPGAKATAALRELLDQLEAKGWTVTHEGRHWYSFTLERPL
jgi:hypothetical protein